MNLKKSQTQKLERKESHIKPCQKEATQTTSQLTLEDRIKELERRMSTLQEVVEDIIDALDSTEDINLSGEDTEEEEEW